MFCNECGKQLEEGDVFCGYCGARQIPQEEVNSQAGEQPVVTPEPQPSPTPQAGEQPVNTTPVPPQKKKPIALIAIVALVVVGVVGFLVGKGNDSYTPVTNTTPKTTPAPKQTAEKNTGEVTPAGDWKLTSALHNKSEMTIPQNVTITLSIDTSKEGSHNYDLYGFAGVNNYSGPVSIDGEFYTGGPFAMTMFAGEPEIVTFERFYLESLCDADLFNLTADGNSLEIAKSSGEIALLFERMKFDDSHWILAAYFDGFNVQPINPSMTVPELVFESKSDIGGFSGSNYIIGTYDVNYATREISFKDIGTTKITVPSGEVAISERSYIDLLKKASRYIYSGNTLAIVGIDGTTLLVFSSIAKW